MCSMNGLEYAGRMAYSVGRSGLERPGWSGLEGAGSKALEITGRNCLESTGRSILGCNERNELESWMPWTRVC